MDRELKDKVIVITGAASGIGFNIAEKYLQNQVATVIILDIQQDKGEESAKILNEKYGNRVVFKKCDVTTDLDTIFDEIISTYKCIDVLINNAGISGNDNPRLVITVNVIAPIEWTYKFRAHMSKENGGRGGTIINIGSSMGMSNVFFASTYQASKYGINGFTRAIGDKINYDSSDVRVITLCPGFTKTPLIMKFLDEDAEKNIPTNILEFVRKCTYQDVDAVGDAAVDVFKKADTGSLWIVDGGVLSEHLYTRVLDKKTSN